MTYLDTNVLIYSVIKDFDIDKYNISKDIIIREITNGTLFISPMVMSEFVYVLSKSEIDNDITTKEVEFFSRYVNCVIDKETVKDAFELTNSLNRTSSINDGVHIKLAGKYCDKLITFDKGYKTFIGKVLIDINIL